MKRSELLFYIRLLNDCCPIPESKHFVSRNVCSRCLSQDYLLIGAAAMLILELFLLIAYYSNMQSRSSRTPKPPIGWGPHCQKGPQIVLKDPKLHQFKNKVLLGEWDFLRSDSIYFSFKIFRYRLLSNSVINCIMMS